MTTLSILASIAGISMGLSSIPQIYRIYLRKSAADISKITHIIIVLGAFIWMLYGFEINSIPIIISNFIGILTNALILIGCYFYRDTNRY
jgi:MtN3 and saliva related transmembrane protein